MFGHQDDQPANNPAGDQPTNDAAVSTDPDDQPSGQPPQPVTSVAPDSAPAEPVTAATTPSPDNSTPAWQHPGAPIDGNKDANEPISPAGGYPMRPTYQYAAGAPPADDKADPSPAPVINNDGELIDIKDKALDELSPLIDKLDLPPEEKFRTLMMMIQASDNQDLVKDAYTSAHAIQDEKARAQALLDIINEVNYFTSPHSDEAEKSI